MALCGDFQNKFLEKMVSIDTVFLRNLFCDASKKVVVPARNH